MKYFVISLARTPQRLEHFRAANPGSDRVEWFEAVEGRSLDRTALATQGIIAPGLSQYSDAALGCALSHRRLWQHAIELGETITIFEDDALLNRHFFGKVEAYCASGNAWDTVHWGWNFNSALIFMMPGDISPCVAHFSEDHLRANGEPFQALDIPHLVHRLVSLFGIMAYTISPAGAAKLLEGCFPLRDMTVHAPILNRSYLNTGIDVAMNVVFPHIQSFVSFPPLAVSMNEQVASTIQAAG